MIRDDIDLSDYESSSEYCKAMGLVSATEAASILETTPQTLRDWKRNYPRRYMLAVSAAAAYKKAQKEKEKALKMKK